MLFAVEGGGFFSSSASGYSKGLMLLLIGHNKDKRLMRVAPFNQYQLVDRKVDLDNQLATKKIVFSRGCACFHRAYTGVDGPSPPKIDPVKNPESLSDSKHSVDEREDNLCIRSNLKKESSTCDAITSDSEQSCNSVEEGATCNEKRRIQWTDSCGGDLVEIREFEPSEIGSLEEDFEHDDNHKCGCVIQ